MNSSVLILWNETPVNVTMISSNNQSVRDCVTGVYMCMCYASPESV